MVNTQAKQSSKRSIERLVFAGAGIVIAISALILLTLILTSHEEERLRAQPIEGRLEDTLVSTEGSTEVAGIDWDYWLSVNPDIVAWITIPGTPIDYPVVQASASDPTHYLNYDVYNDYNYYGCLYIDAASSIDADNTIIFGHSMFDSDTMFTALTYYYDIGYFNSHSEVIIQTPDKTYSLKARAATEVSPNNFVKKVDFKDREEFKEHYFECWTGSPVRTAEPYLEEVEKLFTLITCYSGGATRTIVYVG